MPDLAREVADLRARLAVAERRLDIREGRGRRRAGPGRAMLALALLLVLVPGSVLASAPFTDLDPAQNAGHNPNVESIYAAGITRGCNPPENDNYCPKDAVTREQMASFLARTAGLGGNPPVANALTAVNAQNAVLLDGQPASAYVRGGADAAVANLLVSSDVVAQGDIGAYGNLGVGGNLVLAGTVQSANFQATSVFSGVVGPLPLTSRSITTGGGALLVFISGSGYRTSSPGPLRLVFSVGGVGPLYVAASFTNELNSHKPIVGTILIGPSNMSSGIPPGTHQFTLAAGTGTVTDLNDTFSVTILELPLACGAFSSCP